MTTRFVLYVLFTRGVVLVYSSTAGVRGADVVRELRS